MQEEARAEFEALEAEHDQLWDDLARLHAQPPDLAAQWALRIRIERHRQHLLAWRDRWLRPPTRTDPKGR